MRVHATAHAVRHDVYSCQLRAECGVVQSKAYLKRGNIQNRTPLRCTGLACPCAHELCSRRKQPLWRLQLRSTNRSGRVTTAANPPDVYVFHLEGVLCEEDGQVYSGAEQLKTFEAPFYITTGLEAAKVADILKSVGISMPLQSPQLFSGLSPEQTVDTLRRISQRPLVQSKGARLNFLTASADAIRAAKSDAELDKLRIFLAAWSREGQAAKKLFSSGDGISVLEEKQLEELLKWGLLMGVDDGCGEEGE